MSRKSLGGVGLLAILVILFFGAVPAWAATLCVAPGGAGGCYSSIQAAVTAASSGDTINVAAGTYVEVVNVTKSLTLSGEPGAKIKPDNSTPKYDGTRRPAIYINAVSGVTVQGFEIDGTGGEVNYGIYPFNSNNTIVKNNVVHDITTLVGGVADNSAGVGITYFGWGQGTDGALVQDNTVYNTGRMGIWVGGMQSSSPYNFIVSNNNTINHNTVYNAWQGPTTDGGGAVQMNCPKSSIFENNTIHDTGLNWYGIYVAGSSTGNSITGNEIYNNNSAIVIWSNVTFCDWGGNPAGAPEAHSNSLHNNVTYGLRNVDTDSAFLVNAENNWWGCVTGPNTDACDKTSGNVDYTPWLTSPGGGTPTQGNPNGDGVINVIDARICLMAGLGFITLNAAQTAACDVDHDGDVDLADAQIIAQVAIGGGSLSASGALAFVLSPLLLLGFVVPLWRRRLTMKWLRNRVLFVLPLLLGLGLLLTACVGTSPAGLFFTHTSLAQTGYGTLTLSASNFNAGGGLASIQVANGGLTFNPALFIVTDIQGLNGFTVLAKVIDNSSGKVSFAAVDPSGGVTTGAVVQFSLAQKGVGSTTVQIDRSKLTLGDANNNAIPTSSVNVGSDTISIP